MMPLHEDMKSLHKSIYEMVKNQHKKSFNILILLDNNIFLW